MDKATCICCNRKSDRTSRVLGVCVDCLRSGTESARQLTGVAHEKCRRLFGLPPSPPRDPSGTRCDLCSNNCLIGNGNRGYCGLRETQAGQLVHLAGTPAQGLVEWYHDPLPTNCVADWVCEGSKHPGFHNLAVFYGACTADCLFCQNWHFKEISPSTSRLVSAEQLAAAANDKTFCVCFFGGDPASQMPHALATARLLASRGVRVCWETNGMMHPRLLDAALELSFHTGGCIKFDLKAFNDTIHRALTGVSNERTFENFTRAGTRFFERPNPPLVVASTLLVPGYVDSKEVNSIARFVASVDPRIPYALLAFAPHFMMKDLPRTTRQEARQAEAAARSAGLQNVRIANQHLLV